MNDTPAARRVDDGLFNVSASFTVLMALALTADSMQKGKITAGLLGPWFLAFLMVSTGVLSWRLKRKSAGQGTPPAPSASPDQAAKARKGALVCSLFSVTSLLATCWISVDILRALTSPTLHWGLKALGANLFATSLYVLFVWWINVAKYVDEVRRARSS